MTEDYLSIKGNIQNIGLASDCNRLRYLVAKSLHAIGSRQQFDDLTQERRYMFNRIPCLDSRHHCLPHAFDAVD